MLVLEKSLQEMVEKRSSYFYKIMKNSLKPKGENVLIISDYGTGDNNMSGMLGYGYYHAAKKRDMNVTVLCQGIKKGFMFADDHIIDAVNRLPNNSLVIVTVSNKLGKFGEEKSFRNFCAEKGHRFLSATGLADVKIHHFDLFLEAMNVNYSRMKKKGMAIKKLWDKAEEIRVKTSLGTDVTFNVKGMLAVANIGEYHEPGTGGNMPAGEVYIPPRGYNGVNGKIVIDGSMKTDEGAILLQSPITLFVQEGKVVKMEGQDAHLLEQTFRHFEDRAKYPERVRFVGELGIGINPGAVLIGSMIIDEKVLGTGHIAIGSNYWFGGDIKTIYNVDHLFKNPE
ncbi:MAG: aminopeptidase, partial [Nanoarchaeota archaeon]